MVGEKSQCWKKADINILRTEFATSNWSNWNNILSNHGNHCITSNFTDEDVLLGKHYDDKQTEYDIDMRDIGLDIYAFTTPGIITIGCIGNLISLKVFTSKVMRRLSASLYLAALSVSDLMVLLIHVLLVWLNKGLPRWPGEHRVVLMNMNGLCHSFLFFSYTFRLASVWLIVIFTIERFIAVCRPLHRKRLCTKPFARKLILTVFIFGAALSIYKPLLSGVYIHGVDQEPVCTRNPNYDHVSFVLDSLYGAIILTIVPFIVIASLNICILRRLVGTGHPQKNPKLVIRENRIRVEFTIILLAISTCFICLNLPYFVLWCHQFWHNLRLRYAEVELDLSGDRMSGQTHITRTIFYVNYCINFFLYTLTGAYYRREIRSMFRYGFMTKHHQHKRQHQQHLGELTPCSNSTGTEITRCACTFI